MIDLDEISEGTVQALVGFPARGLYSIENPSTEMLIEYFGEYSLASKAYRTQGGEDPLFREVVHVLLKYGFVHPRPPTMPKKKAGFIIATFEGLKEDWSMIVADSLWAGIGSVVDGKKAWCGLAHWITLLVPPPQHTPSIKRSGPGQKLHQIRHPNGNISCLNTTPDGRQGNRLNKNMFKIPRDKRR